jgi:hypothetical protein
MGTFSVVAGKVLYLNIGFVGMTNKGKKKNSVQWEYKIEVCCKVDAF